MHVCVNALAGDGPDQPHISTGGICPTEFHFLDLPRPFHPKRHEIIDTRTDPKLHEKLILGAFSDRRNRTRLAGTTRRGAGNHLRSTTIEAAESRYRNLGRHLAFDHEQHGDHRQEWNRYFTI